MKKCIKNWKDVLFILLLTIICVFAVLVACLQNDFLVKTFLLFVAITCLVLSYIVLESSVKTFKADNKFPNGKWKVNTVTFWLDCLLAITIFSSYLLLACGILFINLVLVNICVIAIVVYLLFVIAKVIFICRTKWNLYRRQLVWNNVTFQVFII